MRLPGSRQLGLAKQLLEHYPWYRLEPHPEWATWAPESGKVATGDEFEVPYTAGIPGELRITYAPLPRSVWTRNLDAGRGYAASGFNPVTGELKELGPVRADSTGSWTANPPPGARADWVLILKR